MKKITKNFIIEFIKKDINEYYNHLIVEQQKEIFELALKFSLHSYQTYLKNLTIDNCHDLIDVLNSIEKHVDAAYANLKNLKLI